MSRSTIDIFEQARLAQRRYEELTRGNSYSLLRAAQGISANTALMERIAGNQNNIFERAALGPDMASRIAEFSVNQSFSDLLGTRSSLLEAAKGVSAATSIAQKMVDQGPLAQTIRDLHFTINHVTEQQRLSFAALNETIVRATSGYQRAYRIVESIGLELAKQQQGIIAAISQMPIQQVYAMAQMLEELDVGDWEDIEELETADSDALQSRLIAVILAVLSRLDPREWGPGDYLAILFFIMAWNNPDFTQEDRHALTETRELAQLAAENAGEAAEALEDIKHAEIARQQVIQYISELPRAEVKVKGNVRQEPSGSSRQIIGLKQGAAIAVIEKQRDWLRIIYRDELTDDLAEGWLWCDSAILLDPLPSTN